MRNSYSNLLFSFVFVLLIANQANAQFGPSPWTAPDGTYTVPLGVISMQVECWGGGGAGGGAIASQYTNPNTGAAGGGGGGGAYSIVTSIGVTPGKLIKVINGQGGIEPIVAQDGGNGTASSVTYNSVVVASADGGIGGKHCQTSGAFCFGAGGNGASTGIGIVHRGGNGADGDTTFYSRGGGGGGGGGSNENGGNAVGSHGGFGGALGGGRGGEGYTNTGYPGMAYGGGGSGGDAYVYNGGPWSATAVGSSGCYGKVVITYFIHSSGPEWLNQNCNLCTQGCYINGGAIIPTPTLQTISTFTDSSNYGYVYWTFNASADSTYYFDLCSSAGTIANSWLRLHNARYVGNNYCMDTNSTPTLVMQNNANGCIGTGTGLSKLIWTCKTSGTYYLESAADNLTFWGVSGNQTASLRYKTLPSYSYVCSDIFYDKGSDGNNGNTSNYNNNEVWIYTYYPLDTVGSAISAQFISFSTAASDQLCVYDGSSINAPLIGCYAGPSITGAFSSTANDGSLTFYFTSNDSLVAAGWQANISCIANVGIHNNGSANGVSIYPNPATDELNISFASPLNQDGEIIITDMLGKELACYHFEQAGGVQHLKLPKLSQGIYLARLTGGQQSASVKFVVE